MARAKQADLGVAGGIGDGLLIKHGEVLRKVPENELLSALREEIIKLDQEKNETV